MAEDTKQDSTATAAKQQAARGISYPFISLPEAIEQARAFYAEERKASVPVVVAMKHFGYGEKSSGGRQTVSALIQFGLLEDEGIKDKRMVRLTERALVILLNDQPNSPEVSAALREAARSPKLYSELLSKWPDGLPSDANITYYLKKDRDFNPKTLESFISDFRKSLAFARITGSDTIALVKPLETTPKIDTPPPTLKVGDYVQWESNGVIQFTEPRQVTGISEDGQFVFVTGSLSGIAIKEVSMMQPPAATLMQPPVTQAAHTPTPLRVTAGARQDTFSLDEGNVVLQWPDKMSQESFEDFEAWMQIQLRKIKRSIN